MRTTSANVTACINALSNWIIILYRVVQKSTSPKKVFCHLVADFLNSFSDNQQSVCSIVIGKDTTTPQMRRYTTVSNINVSF